ncbi:MAG: TldD/PmbA family protein [Planctomycetes bacterium]|nr:TldD/PmbA family protein [Planctomycetota bacterium]MCA8972273.1 TldD/PmbA family protein [Planctomycetota bacterium]
MSLDTEGCLELQRAMQRELTRSMRGLRLPSHPRPFFLSYLVHHRSHTRVWGRYGSVFHSSQDRDTDLYVECRVGSYRLDQSLDGGIATDWSGRDSYSWVAGPEEPSPDAVRYALWKLSQHKYEEALQDYYEKKKVLVEQTLQGGARSFSHEPRFVLTEDVAPVRFPKKRWADFVRETSSIFRRHRRLLDPYVEVRGEDRIRVYVNSEGSKFVSQDAYFEVTARALVLSKDGIYLSAEQRFHGRSPRELPTRAQIEAAIERLAEDLDELARSEPLAPYAGPALLSGYASGLLFHEAIGHRLEGERMIARSEGKTFATRIGTQILPEGIDIWDDPTIASAHGKSLFGHYRVDDEGVRAERVQLVENGVLRNFLMSRSSVPGFPQSNGHGRHGSYEDPMARMANLVIEARDGWSSEALEEQLAKLVRDRGLDHGLIIEGVSDGETRTDRYDFQAFKGVPTEVFVFDPTTRRKRRVRDVSFIGTPLAAAQGIVALGRDAAVDNSYCWAESGGIPVSTIAPSMVVQELELQRSTTKRFRPPLLSLPPMRGD